jgi:hypothetical protein
MNNHIPDYRENEDWSGPVLAIGVVIWLVVMIASMASSGEDDSSPRDYAASSRTPLYLQGNSLGTNHLNPLYTSPYRIPCNQVGLVEGIDMWMNGRTCR